MRMCLLVALVLFTAPGDIIKKRGVSTPQPVGACCQDDGFTCDEGLTFTECDPTGLYAGDGTTCAADCGSCCIVESGGCGHIDEITCSLAPAPGADWTAGGVCSPNTCPEPNGACCESDGACLNKGSEEDCTLFGGIWGGFKTACGDGTCASCCELDDATCNWGLASDCLGTVSPDEDCPTGCGSCCNDTDATCSFESQSSCPAGSTWSPGVCSPNTCVAATTCVLPSDITMFWTGDGCVTTPCDTAYTFSSEMEFPDGYTLDFSDIIDNGTVGSIKVVDETASGMGTGNAWEVGSTLGPFDSVSYKPLVANGLAVTGQDYCLSFTFRQTAGSAERSWLLGDLDATTPNVRGSNITPGMIFNIPNQAFRNSAEPAGDNVNVMHNMWISAFNPDIEDKADYKFIINGVQQSSDLDGREIFLYDPEYRVGSSATVSQVSVHIDTIFMSVGADAQCRCGVPGASCSGARTSFQQLIDAGKTTCADIDIND